MLINTACRPSQMVFQTESSSHGDHGHHLLAEVVDSYYDAVKCSERGAHQH